MLCESRRRGGALDKDFSYVSGTASSEGRGFAVGYGGGLMPLAVPSTTYKRDELINSRLWQWLSSGIQQEFQSSIFQPVGGMDRIAQALHRQVASVVQLSAKVTKINQSERGVSVTYVNANGQGGP